MTRYAPLAIALAVTVTTPLTAAYAEPGTPPLNWQFCKDIAREWPKDDSRTECARVRVPLDHAKPAGRTIEIAVTRRKATGERRGAILLNPGGPGASGAGLPLKLTTEGTVADLNKTHDLIGFDPRGVNYSDRVECPETANVQPPPNLSEKQLDKFHIDRAGQVFKQCAAVDPEFTRNLTVTNVAKDMDRIRIALGESKVGFYGVSWGTELGSVYRSLFDGNVDRMLLDSVVAPTGDLRMMDDDTFAAHENNFHEYSAWIARYHQVYGFGTSQPEVTRALFRLREELTRNPRVSGTTVYNGARVTQMMIQPQSGWPLTAEHLRILREGGVPKPLDQAARSASSPDGTGYQARPEMSNNLAYAAIACNDWPGARDFEEYWRHREDRVKRYPAAGSPRRWEAMCVHWPRQGVRPPLVKGSSPLQLVGHSREPVTPIGWAVAMQRAIGGTLMTIADDQHGSLRKTECGGAEAVRFFAGGEPTSKVCPGPTPPVPR